MNYLEILKNKIKIKLRRLKLYFKLRKEGFRKKDLRYYQYVIYGVMSFEEYEKYLDKKIMKEGKKENV